jgi:predicted nucleic acid-binding Zn ribbon protein
MVKPKCTVCSAVIPVERVYAATSRKAVPTYCSEKCKNVAAIRRHRAKAKKA